MSRFWIAHLCTALALAWGAPAGATDICSGSGSGKPAWCPSDARIAALPARLLENNVFFPRGGSSLDDTATAQIAMLARVLRTDAMAGTCLKLVGHSDSSGGAAANAALSERRAEAVRTALGREMGAYAPPMVVEGMGEEAHLAELPTSHVGQRRVTLWAKSCTG